MFFGPILCYAVTNTIKMKICSNIYVLVILKQIHAWPTMRHCSRIYMGWKRGSLFKFLYTILNLALAWVISQFSFFFSSFLLSACLLFLRTHCLFSFLGTRIVSSFSSMFLGVHGRGLKKNTCCAGGGGLYGGIYHILKMYLYCSLTTFDI